MLLRVLLAIIFDNVEESPTPTIKSMFRNILNYVPYEGQINEEPSMTVPDETMALRELVSRYSRGLPIKGIDKDGRHLNKSSILP